MAKIKYFNCPNNQKKAISAKTLSTKTIADKKFSRPQQIQ